MRVLEIIKLQESSSSIVLLRQGLFFRGYGIAALLLNRALGYMVKRGSLKGYAHVLYYVGFPVQSLDKVIEALVEIGGIVVAKSDNLLQIDNIATINDFDVELNKIANCSTSRSSRSNRSNRSNTDKLIQIYDLVERFDVVGSTPIQALEFIAELQTMICSKIVGDSREMPILS